MSTKNILIGQATPPISDTGTIGILLSNSLVDTIYKQIPGGKFNKSDQGYIFPASTNIFPTVVLPIDNTEITLQSPEDFNNGMSSYLARYNGPVIIGFTFLNKLAE